MVAGAKRGNPVRPLHKLQGSIAPVEQDRQSDADREFKTSGDRGDPAPGDAARREVERQYTGKRKKCQNREHCNAPPHRTNVAATATRRTPSPQAKAISREFSIG